jgi:hypothetical protein
VSLRSLNGNYKFAQQTAQQPTPRLYRFASTDSVSALTQPCNAKCLYRFASTDSPLSQPSLSPAMQTASTDSPLPIRLYRFASIPIPSHICASTEIGPKPDGNWDQLSTRSSNRTGTGTNYPLDHLPHAIPITTLTTDTSEETSFSLLLFLQTVSSAGKRKPC